MQAPSNQSQSNNTAPASMDSAPRCALRCLLASILIGLISGGVCVFFYVCTQLSDNTRIENPWLLYLLPAAGLLVVFLYDGLLGSKDLSTGALYRHLSDGKPVSLWIAPLIMLSTCLAYLTGGSVGRAGSALQVGGGLATGIEEKLHAKDMADLYIACGMSAGFTAILNAPLAGAVFGLEVLVLSHRRWFLILPTLISSYITWGIASLCSVTYTDFSLGTEVFAALRPMDYLKISVLALVSTLVARLFCYSRRSVAWAMERYLRNPYLRVLAGTALVILITKLLGNMNCNGVGFSYVVQALNGDCSNFAFLWKLVLTIITLGCGIRGGEIAPNIFIGATFGCAAAPILGLDPCVGAAACLVGVLGSVTNSPLAIGLYGCEVICLSPKAGLMFLIIYLVSHFFSGDISLYREQPSEKIPFKLHLG